MGRAGKNTLTGETKINLLVDFMIIGLSFFVKHDSGLFLRVSSIGLCGPCSNLILEREKKSTTDTVFLWILLLICYYLPKHRAMDYGKS